jgi:antitoxin component YwqK of YwqJK toxin-antitoxin module
MIEVKKEYYESGNIKSKHYYLNGKLHGEDGPAIIYYDENGNIKAKWYYINTKLHREDGLHI